jgi:hypothetical protein
MRASPLGARDGPPHVVERNRSDRAPVVNYRQAFGAFYERRQRLA